MNAHTLLESAIPNNHKLPQTATNCGQLTLLDINGHEPSPIEAQLAAGMDELKLPYESQFEINGMRVDFAFPGLKLVIECDGFDFHHTKDQRNSDTRRDRKLKMRGWEIMRFTGSDIYADALTCALQIQYVLKQIAARRSTAIRDDEFYWCYVCDLHYAPDYWEPKLCPECGSEFGVALYK